MIGNLGASDILAGAGLRNARPDALARPEARSLGRLAEPSKPAAGGASFEDALEKAAEQPVDPPRRRDEPPSAKAPARSALRSHEGAEDDRLAASDEDEEYDLSDFKKIDRTAKPGAASRTGVPDGTNPTRPDDVPRNAQKADERAVAALGAAFFGVAAMRPNAAAAEERADASISALEDFRDSQAVVKQAAMQGFMAEMQAQFGASPKDIVRAFADLSPERLMGPPEGARDAFLNNLGLTGSERVRASALYDQMAQATQEAAMNERVAGEQLNARFEVLTASESKLRSLNLSLDRLNDSFFRRGTPAAGPFGRPTVSSAEAAPLNQIDLAAALQSARDRKSTAGGAALAGTGAGAAMNGAFGVSGASVGAAPSSQAFSAQTLATIAAQAPAGGQAGSFAPDVSGEREETWLDDRLAFGGALGAAAGAVAAGGSTPQAGPSDASFAGLNAQTAAAGAKNAYAGANKTESIETSFGKKGGAAAEKAVPATAPGEAPSDPAAALAAAGPAPRASATATGAMFAAAAKPTPEDSEANVQEIVRQANLIARKGGGEMRLELRPEGMGQVHMKVSVQDGAVNVQMVAESNDAKKLLESSLHELKSGLSAHKLHLEALRVDANDGIQKHMEQQQRDAQREAARQFAGDFMGGFREDREAFRQGFADRFPVRSYRGAPTARVEESSRGGDGGRASSSSRRLDLVA